MVQFRFRLITFLTDRRLQIRPFENRRSEDRPRTVTRANGSGSGTTIFFPAKSAGAYTAAICQHSHSIDHVDGLMNPSENFHSVAQLHSKTISQKAATELLEVTNPVLYRRETMSAEVYSLRERFLRETAP